VTHAKEVVKPTGERHKASHEIIRELEEVRGVRKEVGTLITLSEAMTR